MVPFPMVPTDSAAERRLYEGFLRQLDDQYVVYHSVDWVLAGRGGPIEGEADFVIAHPKDGLLIVEAKGGSLSYDPHSKRWSQSGCSGRHLLDEDPFHQAADEMHSLVQILSAQPGWERWKPSYGYGVAFPDVAYHERAHPAAPPEVAIDHDDLERLPNVFPRSCGSGVGKDAGSARRGSTPWPRPWDSGWRCGRLSPSGSERRTGRSSS